MSDSSIYGNFPSINFEAWKARVENDLKGQDFDKKLRWKSPDGIITEPFYTTTPLSELPSLTREKSQWHIAEWVLGNANGNHLALKALQGGATSICIDMKQASLSPEDLTKDILLEIAPLYFRNSSLNPAMQEFLSRNNFESIHLGFQPLEPSLAQEQQISTQISNVLNARTNANGKWGVFAVDTTIFKEKGSSIIQEIAFSLAQLQEYFHWIQQSGFTIQQAGTFAIYIANGSNYFFEIAKLKALRSLVQTLFESYESAVNVQFIATSTSINKTKSDKHNNILRITTECMSAILGGTDVVMHIPFDLDHQEDDFVRRISRNVQHILAEEAYFDKNTDPAAGSYYIEHLTKEMMDAAWQLFLEVEKKGGYLKLIENGSLAESIAEHLQLLENNIAKRKSILLGANQYPDQTLIEEQNGKTSDDFWQAKRLSEPFEALKIKVQNFEKKHHRRPKVYLFQLGNPVMRKARATFAFNFFGCAGYQVFESDPTATLEENIVAVSKLSPDLLVLCSDNESWNQWKDMKAAFPENTKTVLAGHPSLLPEHLNATDFDFVIFDGCNVLEVLAATFTAIGIE
jgi:methylmalonyl-CoA mutase